VPTFLDAENVISALSSIPETLVPPFLQRELVSRL
jgi:hypothetical protein